jgi:UDP-sulfoquinovose synthase
MDGYLGWSLALHLANRGHQVSGIDGFFRRKWVSEMGSYSAIPIAPMKHRLKAAKMLLGQSFQFWEGDLRTFSFVRNVLTATMPDAIIHLGECPSAPYSMMDAAHASYVQLNNIESTLNVLFAIREVARNAHLIKLGTMGEYGTPGVEIPEGFFDLEFRGRRSRLPFPRKAGSWYHWSKVHGSNNVMFACTIWGLRATDVMQGVVFGSKTELMNSDESLRTRLDFDQAFGTVINRFCCQAIISHPLTPYGKGGQQRGFLPLGDSMTCLTLALENPPSPGEYRVFNQFAKVYKIHELARMVRRIARELGLKATVHRYENPRSEAESHFYQCDHENLIRLGYKPTQDFGDTIRTMLKDLLPHKSRIWAKRSMLVPDVRWDGSRKRSRKLPYSSY